MALRNNRPMTSPTPMRLPVIGERNRRNLMSSVEIQNLQVLVQEKKEDVLRSLDILDNNLYQINDHLGSQTGLHGKSASCHVNAMLHMVYHIQNFRSQLSQNYELCDFAKEMWLLFSKMISQDVNRKPKSLSTTAFSDAFAQHFNALSRVHQDDVPHHAWLKMIHELIKKKVIRKSTFCKFEPTEGAAQQERNSPFCVSLRLAPGIFNLLVLLETQVGDIFGRQVGHSRHVPQVKLADARDVLVIRIRGQREEKMDIPLDLKLKKHCRNEYRLTAVMFVDAGGEQSGRHYFAWVRKRGGNEWMECCDTYKHPVKDHVQTAINDSCDFLPIHHQHRSVSPYIIIYTKRCVREEEDEIATRHPVPYHPETQGPTRVFPVQTLRLPEDRSLRDLRVDGFRTNSTATLPAVRNQNQERQRRVYVAPRPVHPRGLDIRVVPQ